MVVKLDAKLALTAVERNSQKSRMASKQQFAEFLLPSLGPSYPGDVPFACHLGPKAISFTVTFHPSRAAIGTLPNALPLLNIVCHY